jgi:hypothetical protein
MRSHRRIVIVLAALVLISGCFRSFQITQGSGVRTKVTRDVTAFREISVSNAMTVDVTIGSELQVEVEGDDNIVPLVETRVESGSLIISVQGGYSTKIGLKVIIQTPELEKVSGANASTTLLKGQLDRIELNAANASTIDAERLEVKEATVRAANAATILVHATEQLSGEAANASTVSYIAGCKKVDVRSTNASSVNVKGN